MNIKIESKYNIGDFVKLKETKTIYKSKIICPLCKGNYQVDNPIYSIDEDGEIYDEYLICPFCKEGYIETDPVTEEYIEDEVYKIDGILVHINKEDKHKISYSITSRPEYNMRLYGYRAKSCSEDKIVKIENI